MRGPSSFVVIHRVRMTARPSPALWPCLIVVASALAGCAPPPEPGPAPERYGPPPVQPAEDPPSRVGRLSVLEGVVSFRPAATDEWGPAVPNRPVTSGDGVWTDAGGRAEVEAGPVVLRMSQQTELDVVRLDDRVIQLRLPQGTLTERVVSMDGDDAGEIDAPSAAVALRGPGVYRVDVSEDGGTTRVTVWSGQAVVTASGSSFQVSARQVATVQTGNPPTYDLTDAGGADDFDRWSLTRDAYEDRAAQSRQYVPVDMPGSADLEQYGRWDSDPTYGPVWYPANVAPGWAPYRTGHWVWIQPWGWTWVDDAPWGYAPYHYGRWAYVRGVWAWCPGRRVAAAPAPVYAPALVVFVGGPPGGPGPDQRVTWFPLAPEEVYRPAYATSPHYVQQVNVTNVTNVTNITNVTNVTNTTNTTNITNVTYRNRSAPNALTAVSQQTFVTAQPVSRLAVPVTAREVTAAAPVRLAPAAAPTRASLGVSAANVPGGAGGGGGRPSAVPPPVIAARAVVSTRTAPPPPVPFSVQERSLASNGGRPLAAGQMAALRPSAAPRPDVVTLHPSAPAAVRVTKPGALPAAQPGAAAPAQSPSAAAPPAAAPVPAPSQAATPAAAPPPTPPAPAVGAAPAPPAAPAAPATPPTAAPTVGVRPAQPAARPADSAPPPARVGPKPLVPSARPPQPAQPGRPASSPPPAVQAPPAAQPPPRLQPRPRLTPSGTPPSNDTANAKPTPPPPRLAQPPSRVRMLGAPAARAPDSARDTAAGKPKAGGRPLDPRYQRPPGAGAASPAQPDSGKPQR
jgi:uncharacterized protein DUF6600/FecR-like protein